MHIQQPVLHGLSALPKARSNETSSSQMQSLALGLTSEL